MEDKDKVKNLTPEEKAEELKEDGRELSDEILEGVAGGVIPIIDAFE